MLIVVNGDYTISSQDWSGLPNWRGFSAYAFNSIGSCWLPNSFCQDGERYGGIFECQDPVWLPETPKDFHIWELQKLQRKIFRPYTAAIWCLPNPSVFET